MGARTKARKRALDILFSADVRENSLTETLASETDRSDAQLRRTPSWQYATTVVAGIIDHEAAIDEAIAEHAHGWTLARMPAVDRAILRIGTWEILYNDEVPDAVAISEAVQAARTLSTDDSPAFINGLLGAISAARQSSS